MIQWPKSNDALGTTNRGNPCESGLCTLCRADCAGKCETWLSCLVGRKLLYPRDYGKTTAGSSNNTSIGLGYHALRIQGYAYGVHGLASGLTNNPDDCVFPNVNLETSFGQEIKTKCRVPMMTGALGSTFIASYYWDSFAIGAALCGIPIVIGENVVGIDRQAEIKNGRILSAPELDRRVKTFMRYYDGFGAIIVQMNVEDTRNGVAEYVIDKYGDPGHHRAEMGPGRQRHRRRNPSHLARLRPVPQTPRLCGRSQSRRSDRPGGVQEPRHHFLRPPQPPGRHRPRFAGGGKGSVHDPYRLPPQARL